MPLGSFPGQHLLQLPGQLKQKGATLPVLATSWGFLRVPYINIGLLLNGISGDDNFFQGRQVRKLVIGPTPEEQQYGALSGISQEAASLALSSGNQLWT